MVFIYWHVQCNNCINSPRWIIECPARCSSGCRIYTLIKSDGKCEAEEQLSASEDCNDLQMYTEWNAMVSKWESRLPTGWDLHRAYPLLNYGSIFDDSQLWQMNMPKKERNDGFGCVSKGITLEHMESCHSQFIMHISSINNICSNLKKEYQQNDLKIL